MLRAKWRKKMKLHARQKRRMGLRTPKLPETETALIFRMQSLHAMRLRVSFAALYCSLSSADSVSARTILG
jgi:hypothetical protein